MAYAEHIPSQDPNLTEDEMMEQAGQIIVRLARGESASKLAAEFGIGRTTLYRRTALILEHLPPRYAIRGLIFERNEWLFRKLLRRVLDNDEASHADYIRAIAEARQLSQSTAAVFRLHDLSEPEPAPTETNEPEDDWEASQ